MYEEMLKQTAHRNSSLPDSPWLASQLWKDLLFINYPVDLEAIRTLIPNGLQLDTYDGQAWITVLPFSITDFTLRDHSLKGLNNFLELNVRTYVIRNGKPGVYFFSLEADHPITVLGARFLSLPYYLAKMSIERRPKDRMYNFQSERIMNRQRSFVAQCSPSKKTHSVREGGLTEWLVNRYHLYSTFGDRIIEGPIHHRPWKVADANVTIQRNGMLPQLPGGSILEEPYCFYTYQKRALLWPLRFSH
ncbi:MULTISPECIES: YqjF family protein [Allobacillus]|uniref:DUF2071 domain-containing protein n=1 Tax=Allobacillus salarius TaxID=1955272 RepID=A0A556PDJ2_9BACI|nr:DUF2071 domain-containing protein [Allobacillus salarius]TSJ62434.1 DUF2071 domain-containing protein [Allobacillus salarius]